MHHDALIAARGAVLFDGKRHWLIWDNTTARPVCMLIQGQNSPLNRWDCPLDKGDIPSLNTRALMVRTAGARSIETAGMVILAHLTPAVIARIEMTMKRAAHSEAVEARHRIRL